MYRRTVDPCGAYVRVNDQPYPRGPTGDSHTYTEMPPARERTYEYRVAFVDAHRQELDLGYDCFHCAKSGWASCPQFSAPVTHGTLEDWGWALLVRPCAACYLEGYISGSSAEDELRQYAGTDEAVRIYGTVNCATTEGCAFLVDHYEFAACPATPVLHTSWGRVKAIHR